MPFSQRNIFYLRTSAHVVLQTILYLDPRDVRWMNSSAYGEGNGEGVDDDEAESSTTGELVWGRALSKLKNKIMPKLRAESIDGGALSSTNKKEKVDVHIEPDFQMAYFFRKVGGKHAVLLKEKSLQFSGREKKRAAGSTDMPPPALPASAALQSSEGSSSMPVSRLAAREPNQNDNVLAQGAAISTSGEQPPREEVNQRKRRRESEDMMPFEGPRTTSDQQPIRVKEEDDDGEGTMPLDTLPLVQQQEQAVEGAMEDGAMEDEEDEKKPKLHVKYSGFKIFGKCFIVVIEPTKRTKRLRPGLFEQSKPVEVHQLSATPVPRQIRETPLPGESRATPSSRRSVSMTPSAGDERSDSRRDRLANGLFRGTPSEYTPTPTPEPELAARAEVRDLSNGAHEVASHYEDDEDVDNSHSVMLATQMLEGGIAGAGNDIDDD